LEQPNKFSILRRFAFYLIVLSILLGQSIHSQSKKNTDKEISLEEELEELESKQKSTQGNRGTSSPVSSGNQINRSSQNLMMDVSAAMDIVGGWDKNKPRTTGNNLDVRTGEFGFSAAVDQLMRGYFLAAAHGEDGKYFYEIHEAWVQFPFLPFNMSLKAGTMFMDLGRINRIHAHDRPFTQAPIIHQRLFGWESLFDTGAEVSILLPWSFITQELVVGATNGKKWGHAHTEGIPKNNPLGYFHLKNFYYLGNNWGTQFGITGIRFEPDANSKNTKNVFGFDIVFKWNQSNLKAIEIMSETWVQEETTASSFTTTSQNLQSNPEVKKKLWGTYVFADYKFHQQWSLGARYDFMSDLSLKDSNGNPARFQVDGITLQSTFHSSEFGKIRGSVERRYTFDESLSSDQATREYRYYLQFIGILGSHPAHTY
jgi:hypothetical protein